MIIYNVTIQVDPDIHQEWLSWMQEKHIPDVLVTGCFMESRISRMLAEEDTGITYSIQYTAENQEAITQYLNLYAEALQKDHHLRYQDRYVAFRSMMEVVTIHFP
ncbi:MAG: DUF4286 family protein [Flavobacteriales bacterium]|nr:DUF4286 family protein [Flavobacteriales bacterium]